MFPDFWDTLYVQYTGTNTTDIMSDTTFLCHSIKLYKTLKQHMHMPNQQSLWIQE